MQTIKEVIALLYCWTIGLPSQIIFGWRKSNQYYDEGRSLEEYLNTGVVLWYEETAMGRIGKCLMDWANN